MWSIEKLSDSPTRLAAVRELVREYVLLPDAWAHRGGPPESLPPFFASEIAALPLPAHPPMGDIAMAVDDRQVLGIGFLVPFDKTAAELKRLYVKTDARGNGVGRAIVISLIEVAKELEYRSVILDVIPSRTNALDLYRSLGFTTARPFRRYDAHEMLFFKLLL
jgi:ribosomal protein S18 acetylase RimI-like enzyme